MKNKKIRKETLRKLLKINTDYYKKQNIKINSLEGQLEFMIKERNNYRDKFMNFISLKKELKISKAARIQSAKAYAKAIGVLKEKKWQ